MKKIQGVYEENGYTRIRIWLGRKRNEDGSENPPYRRSMGPWNNENIQRAKNQIEEVRGNFKKGVGPRTEAKALPFPEACDIYYRVHWKQKQGRSAAGIRNIGYFVDRFRQTWRERSFHSILPSDIEKYVEIRKSDGVKVSTVNRELAILSSMFTMIDHWVNRREIGPYLLPTSVLGATYNPVSYVDRASTVEFKRKRTATDEELRKVKVYCDKNDPDMLEIITRSLLTGLRKADLERVNGKADVRGVLSKSHERKLFEFPVDFSRKLNYKNFPRRWNALRDTCKMQDFHWHDWRHTSGTLLKRLGFTDEQIREFYGHSTVQQTRDYINMGKERQEPNVAGLKRHLGEVFASAATVVADDLAKKICRGCLKPLDLSQFGRHSGFKSGLDSRCKACNYARLVDQRRRNPALRAKEYAQRAADSIVASSVSNGVSKRRSLDRQN